MAHSPPVVIAVNYHRVGAVDPANPYHRLHTVPTDVFAAHLDWMRSCGPIVSPDDVREARDLADVNFVVSFDDVPVAALDTVRTLLDEGMPVTISPCGQLADHGLGTRDKVYAIEALTPAEEIRAHVAAVLKGTEHERTPFYELTKSDRLRPDRVRATLIEPLYARVRDRARHWFDERGYLAWEQIRALSAHPLVTVANHTRGHDNLDALTRDALERELWDSHAHFTRNLGRPGRYLTVPFGRLTQELALDCLPTLVDLDYHGILWVGPAGLTVHGPYRHQLLNLPRLHANPTLAGFIAQAEHARRASTRAAIWQVPPTPHRDPVHVRAARDPRPALLAEMILRQGKDHASDPAFHRHQFADNPHRGDRPDYHVAEHDGRIEAIVYNFHTLFVLDGVQVPGVYVAGWRRFPHAHPTAAGRLLHTLTTREAVVGVHNPNPDIAHAFTHWHRARVHHLTLPVPADPPPAPADHETREHARFPAEFAELCAHSARRARFTVLRDATYHRWRHSTPPHAAARYLALHRHDEPAALGVLLAREDTVHLIDFHLADPDAATPLLTAALRLAARRHATVLHWDTSDPNLAAAATRTLGATGTTRDNFYHFNTAVPGPPEIALIRANWPNLPLHETGTTGDVLPR